MRRVDLSSVAIIRRAEPRDFGEREDAQLMFLETGAQQVRQNCRSSVTSRQWIEMRRMPLHSTADNRLVSREELRNAAPEQQRLGTWTALGPGNIGGRTRTILINPQDPNVMYAAGVAGGVWKSINAGGSWTPLADMIANIAVNSMAFDPMALGIIGSGNGKSFTRINHQTLGSYSCRYGDALKQ